MVFSFGISVSNCDLLEEFEKDPQFELMVKRDKRRFERADGDDDKALDKDEYVRFMHPEESPDMADIVIDVRPQYQ